MPVVATLTLIALLSGRSGQNQPFSDPAYLRKLLSDALKDDEDLLQKALATADDLDVALGSYLASVDTTLDAYIEESKDSSTRAPELIARLEPLDQERSLNLKSVIGLRQSLLDLLSDQQWKDVFLG